MRWLPASAVAAMVAAALAPPATGWEGLTVYSSLPRQGAQRPQAEAIIAGARRALTDSQFRAGGEEVRYISLDSSTAQAGTWTPEVTARNARTAAQDETTIAYLGEFNSSGSGFSIPILNEAGILQISPSNTFDGLTRAGAGAAPGEPDRYYPTGRRTYGRIIPNDTIQARAAAALLQTLGRRHVMLVHDGGLYGRSVVRIAADSLAVRGVEVVGIRELDGTRRRSRRVARASRNADALFYAGVTDDDPQDLWRRLARRRSLVKVAADALAQRPFFDDRYGGISARAARNTYILVATLAPFAYPPAGQDVLRAMGNPDIYALYGYEAMALALDAVNRGGPTRDGAIQAFFATRDRDSLLGRYSIDENGDTTMTQYGVYRVDRRRLEFDRVVDAGP